MFKLLLRVTILGLASWMVSHILPGDVMNPVSTAYAARSPSSLFVYVDSMGDLQKKLRSAKNAGKPVMIEFYASWCPVCRKVDQTVLSDRDVQASMRGFTAIRVDVSETNASLNRMMEEYQVYGVPTMIFYDKNGKLFETNKLNSGITKQDLISTLRELS